jgi:hypothetical protein
MNPDAGSVDRHVVIVTAAGSFTVAGERLTGPVDAVDKLEKLISWSAFQLKGGGWYKDLYSSNPKAALHDKVDRGVPPKAGERR